MDRTPRVKRKRRVNWITSGILFILLLILMRYEEVGRAQLHSPTKMEMPAAVPSLPQRMLPPQTKTPNKSISLLSCLLSGTWSQRWGNKHRRLMLWGGLVAVATWSCGLWTLGTVLWKSLGPMGKKRPRMLYEQPNGLFWWGCGNFGCWQNAEGKKRLCPRGCSEEEGLYQRPLVFSSAKEQGCVLPVS